MKIVLNDGARMPTRAHDTDAGLDLYSTETKWVNAKDSARFDTGVHIELPPDTVGYIKSKSGLNVKFGLQSEGVIDEGYTGSIVVKLYNHSNEDYLVRVGDKISQLVIHPIVKPELEMEDKIMGNNKTEVKILTQEEWRKEGRKRFGLDFKNWKFKCPNCGNIASGAEFKEAGAEPNAIYQECIGRYVKGKGCNWAAYGLFDTCTVRVEDVPVFEFGEGDAK